MKVSLRVGCITCGEEVIATGTEYGPLRAALLKHGWRIDSLRLGTGHCPACHGLDSNEKPTKLLRSKEITHER